MGVGAAARPAIHCRTPIGSAAALRRIFLALGGWGWDERFHATVVEELASLVSECQKQSVAERVIAHLILIRSKPTTHPEIASAVGLPRETVTRALISLRAAGRVRATCCETGPKGSRRVYTVLG